MRYFVTFAYNGTDFHGSQTQPNGITVQETMEQTISTILRVPTALTFAGRTDAGVHAEKMVAHFDCDKPLPANLLSRLNKLLPASIAIREICPVKEDAHARFDAVERTYHYRLATKKDPFSCQFRTKYERSLDFAQMNRAARHLIGQQDFASFCRTHTDVKTTICDVRQAEWIVENDHEACFVITADRFLRNMVRAIVGTLFEVGLGRMSEQEFAALD